MNKKVVAFEAMLVLACVSYTTISSKLLGYYTPGQGKRVLQQGSFCACDLPSRYTTAENQPLSEVIFSNENHLVVRNNKQQNCKKLAASSSNAM